MSTGQDVDDGKAIMLKTQAIAETFGVKFWVDVERRIEGARKIGAHKTSMLQDLERGRPMEIGRASCRERVCSVV